MILLCNSQTKPWQSLRLNEALPCLKITQSRGKIEYSVVEVSPVKPLLINCLVLLNALTLLSGCAARQDASKGQARANAYYAARSAVTITTTEPSGCHYVKSQQTEGYDYNNALMNIKSYAVSANANTVVVDNVTNILKMNMQTVRLHARLFYCAK